MNKTQKMHIIDHVQNCIDRENGTIEVLYNLIDALNQCVAVASEMTITECETLDVVRGIARKYANEHNKTLNSLYKYLGGIN